MATKDISRVVTPFPALLDRPIPTDPDAVLALIKLGRHLESIDERLRAMCSAHNDTFRTRSEEMIEELLTFLDWDDISIGSEDDEDADPAEPSLGWTDQESRWGKPPMPGAHAIDAEIEDEHDEEGGDSEPSLASLDRAVDQRDWSGGNAQDLEDEHDGREPDDGW